MSGAAVAAVETGTDGFAALAVEFEGDDGGPFLFESVSLFGEVVLPAGVPTGAVVSAPGLAGASLVAEGLSEPEEVTVEAVVTGLRVT